MRLVTAAALAAVLLLTGCGTPVAKTLAEPWQEDTSERDAIAFALLACEWFDDGDKYWPYEASSWAAEAAYFDPRWRPLADAMPVAEDFDAVLRAGIDLGLPDGFRSEVISAFAVVRAECKMVERLSEAGTEDRVRDAD